MRLCLFLLLIVSAFCPSGFGQKRAIFPANAPKPVGPYSPGVIAGNYLYVAGQGVRRPDGKQSDTFEAQARQCLENIRAIVKAGGLSMRDVVYTQAHVLEESQIPVVERLYREYFPEAPPARSTVRVRLMPTATPVEINAVAYRGKRTPVRVAGYDEPGWQTPAIAAGDRIYLSGASGTDVKQAVASLRKTLERAGADLHRVALLHVYRTPEVSEQAIVEGLKSAWTGRALPALAFAEILSLPAGAKLQITGIDARPQANLELLGAITGVPARCATIESAAFCSTQNGKSDGTLAAAVEQQVSATFQNIAEALSLANLKVDDVVAATVYLDDLDEFQRMNQVYATQFEAGRPARTTLQPAPKLSSRQSASGPVPVVAITVVAER